jgi:WD40 repeat protein
MSNLLLEDPVRRAIAGIATLLSWVAPALPAQAPPATDLFVAPLSTENGAPTIGGFVNVTRRPGYDNQPAFTPDSRAILFTSIHDDGQADIYRLDLASRAITRVTATPESEYSPTPMPGGRRFSTIRVEKDSTQRLWSFAMDGSDPRVVLEMLKPVGYHAWIDANNLALFVLGNPNALVHADTRTGKADTLARDIGRSLLPLPDGSGFSFVQRADSSFVVKTMAWPGAAVRELVRLPRGSQDVAWLAPGVLITSSGSTLRLWRAGTAGWVTLGDYADAGLTNISRLAVSPNGKWLAVVAIPKL